MNTYFKLSLAAFVALSAFSANAMTFGKPKYLRTMEANALSASSLTNFPECDFEYDTLGGEFVQRVAFYVTKDVLNYATKEDVSSWVDEQIGFANISLRNNCVKLKKEVALVRFVNELIDQEFYGKTYNAEDLNVVDYQSMISGMNSTQGGVLQATSQQMKSDWKEFGFDRVVNVIPHYRKYGNGVVCGVGGNFFTRPNAEVFTYMDAPNNSWGSETLSSQFFATVAWPNNPMCESKSIVAHELGHTDGLFHERGQQPTVNYDDTLGYAASCGGHNSIMYSGIDTPSALGFFSSPNLTINGEACGDPSTVKGVDSVETLHFNLGLSSLHSNPRDVPHQGVVDAGDSGQVGDTSTWNFITNTRHSNNVAVGSVEITDSPTALSESDEVLAIEVTRTDSSADASVVVKLEGEGAYAGADFEAEKVVSFVGGQNTETVEFSIYESNIPRAGGTVTVSLAYPSIVELGEESTVSLSYTPNKQGDVGRAKLAAAEIYCDADCTDGTIEVERTGGTEGELPFDLVIREDGDLVTRLSYSFLDGESALSLPYSSDAITSLTTIDIEAAHPVLVEYGRLFFSYEYETTPDPETETTPETDNTETVIVDEGQSASGGGGSGGSMSLGLLALLGLTVLRRQTR